MKAIGDFIETDPNDTEAENRFRNMLQDVVPSAFIEGLVKVVSKVRNMDADTLIEAGGEAEQRLDSMMSGTTLSANPVGAAGDALVAGAGKVAEAIKPVEPAPVFYSAVANAVDALPMEKGNASQMRAMIAKSAEVKPEEMAWIGLDDFLKGKKSVTKQEIKDFVDANQVRIEEVVKGGREIDADYITKLREAEARYTVAEHDIEFDADEGGFVTYLYGEPLYDFGGELRLTKTEEEAREVLYDQALESAQQIPEGELLELGNTTGPGGLIKFSDYTLPGGENYREVLLRLPSNEPVPITKLPDGYEVAPLEGHPTAKYTLVGPSGVGSPVGGSTLEEATDQAIERLSIDPPKSPEFTGGHYDESNVLAHMRLNDRTGPNGEKILFVEEIQSDWHQKGRKQGYKTSDQFAEPFQVKSQEDSDSYIMYEVRDANGELITNVGSEYAQNSDQAIVVAQGRIRDQTRLVAGDDRFFVPDAPLKKTWHEMSFRRIARMAAEEGYDAIAWTPGKLQAERYDLSTRIDGIEVIPEGNNQVEIMVKAKGEDSYQTLATNVPEDKIADHIGKELAEKAMKKIGDNSEDTFALSREYDKFNKRVRDGEVLSDADGDRMNEVARLLDLPQEAAAFTGVDLEIGGEGMKGFYDKMLKGYASKWGKKFGAKVGVTDLETGKGMKIRRRGVDSPLEQETKTEKVWTLPVTKKMRDSVLGKGVATFGAAGVAAGLNNEARPNGD